MGGPSEGGEQRSPSVAKAKASSDTAPAVTSAWIAKTVHRGQESTSATDDAWCWGQRPTSPSSTCRRKSACHRFGGGAATLDAASAAVRRGKRHRAFTHCLIEPPLIHAAPTSHARSTSTRTAHAAMRAGDTAVADADVLASASEARPRDSVVAPAGPTSSSAVQAPPCSHWHSSCDSLKPPRATRQPSRRHVAEVSSNQAHASSWAQPSPTRGVVHAHSPVATLHTPLAPPAPEQSRLVAQRPSVGGFRLGSMTRDGGPGGKGLPSTEAVPTATRSSAAGEAKATDAAVAARARCCGERVESVRRPGGEVLSASAATGTGSTSTTRPKTLMAGGLEAMVPAVSRAHEGGSMSGLATQA